MCSTADKRLEKPLFDDPQSLLDCALRASDLPLVRRRRKGLLLEQIKSVLSKAKEAVKAICKLLARDTPRRSKAEAPDHERTGLGDVTEDAADGRNDEGLGAVV